MTKEDFLILVDENDTPWGKLEKSLVHQKGLLHRAFSVFIFNTSGELLLQQRSDEKYHSAGLWTNTCCSHPRYGEYMCHAIERRLEEEMGLKCNTEYIFSFRYKIAFENGLTEHEIDHVYFGITDDAPHPASSEVKKWEYTDLHTLGDHLIAMPEQYTFWLRECYTKVLSHYRNFATVNNLKTKSYVPV